MLMLLLQLFSSCSSGFRFFVSPSERQVDHSSTAELGKDCEDQHDNDNNDDQYGNNDA
jgi:hypothetical protein